MGRSAAAADSEASLVEVAAVVARGGVVTDLAGSEEMAGGLAMAVVRETVALAALAAPTVQQLPCRHIAAYRLRP